ncbi:hypothetical protein ABSL28_004469 [Yersinia enterocolitica]|uniref:hypothetical protein n=1 Tax=Yersinia enterocolitica TaxID=630 RepID=UPI002A575871|nr:hypothetical protein [Yersinia enterocolitica]
MNNIEELKKVALAATPGPWEKCDSYGPNENGTCISAVERPDLMIASTTGYYGRVGGIANTHFIALANPAVILDLIAQLEAAQKESDVYAKLASDVGDIITLLQNNKWAEHIGKTNVGGLLEYQITRLMNSIADINTKLLAAEAALSAANEKVSKPVVLPRMHVGFDGVSTNAGDSVRNKAISDCAEAIRTAGFTVEGE